MAKTIDTLIKKLPKKHNLSSNRDDNGVSINITVPGEGPDDPPVYGLTLRVDGDLSAASDAALVAAELLKEYD